MRSSEITSTGCSTTQIDGVVAPCVRADPAELLLGQVAALAAEAHALLHLLDRGCERERFVLAALEDVEGEPLRRARADARQPGELRDEIVDRGAEHRRSLAVRCGRSWPRSGACSQDQPFAGGTTVRIGS